MNLCNLKGDKRTRVHEIIDKFADNGFRSLAVARQEVPEATKESIGGPWEFMGLLPIFDPPRHDSGDTIEKALHLGVNVKMITGDQLAIAKETGRRLGMGINMHHSTALFGSKGNQVVDIGVEVDDLIEQADGFAGVFPGLKHIDSLLLSNKIKCKIL